MVKKLLFKPDLNILVMVIMLLFGKTPMQWISRSDIEIPAYQNNTIIKLPIKQYPQTKIQLKNIIFVIKFIYSILTKFLSENEIYDNTTCKSKCDTKIAIDMSPDYLYIIFRLPHLQYCHIDAIKSAACTTILINVKKNKLTTEQKACAIYLAAFNTLNIICHNKSKYSNESIHSILSPSINLIPEIIPNVANILHYSQYIRNTSIHASNIIIYYPMKLNLMSNNSIISSYVISYFISIFHYMHTLTFSNKLEHNINKYMQYYDTEISTIYDSDFIYNITTYTNLLDNVFIN